jgi:hypothetical protein
MTFETLWTLNLKQIILLRLAIKAKSWLKDFAHALSHRGCTVIFLKTPPVHFYLGR